jgi:hypothetical protein
MAADKFAWHLSNYQAYIQDVDRRVTMAAFDKGISPEVLDDCVYKLEAAIKLLKQFPEKL